MHEVGYEEGQLFYRCSLCAEEKPLQIHRTEKGPIFLCLDCHSKEHPNIPQKMFAHARILPLKHCPNCGTLLLPHSYENLYRFSQRRFCDIKCLHQFWDRHPERINKIREAKLKDKNPNWVPAITPAGGRTRSRRWFPKEPCEICASAKSERHHKDSNPTNTDKGNIQFLCRRHHMEIDGRLQNRNERGQFSNDSNRLSGR